MKAFLCVCYLVIVLNASGWAIKTPEIQAGQTLHETWELAFERANINAVEELWARNPDVLLVTPLGTRHKGFASVKAALKNVFELFGQTKLDVSERFLTLNGNEASITTTYRWSPAENVVFRSTEHLTKIHDQWKIQIADAQGNLLPLRLLDETAIKRLASKVQSGILAKDNLAIAAVVTDDFTYTDFNGTRYLGWLASQEIVDTDIKKIAALKQQSMTLMENQACGQYTLTQGNGDTRQVRFTFAGPNWKLATIDLHPDAETLAIVNPNRKHPTTWGQIKARQRQ